MRSASSSENSLDAIRLCSASSAPFLSFFFATIDTSLESALLVDFVCLGPLPCLGMLVVFCLRLCCASPGRGLTPVRWLVGWLASQLGVQGYPGCFQVLEFCCVVIRGLGLVDPRPAQIQLSARR